MIKTLRNLKKRDLIFILAIALLVFAQVWLELKMPDYTLRLTESVSSGNVQMDEVLKNGGMMLLCAVGSMASAIICGLFAAKTAASFAKTLREKLYSRISEFSIYSFFKPFSSLILYNSNRI